MRRIVLYIKGICMGVADVIPGVSGGTFALILGIYRELLDAIRSFQFNWVLPLIRWAYGGRGRDFEEFREEFGRIQFSFLIPLGLGIVTALLAGGLVIPGLLERYPEQTRALFFGLIAGSIWIPFRMARYSGGRSLFPALLTGLAAAFAVFVLTGSAVEFDWARSWQSVEAEAGEHLGEVVQRVPSAISVGAVYESPRNSDLRQRLEAGSGESLEAAEGASKAHSSDSGYGELRLPEGAKVQIPRISFLYLIVVGLFALCAAVLPGISGAYILLILGAYTFVLNLVHGLLVGLSEGSIYWTHLIDLAGFTASALVGLYLFSNLLGRLLERFPVLVYSGLVGLMVGGLRGVWPFRRGHGRMAENIMPDQMTDVVVSSIVIGLLGCGIVLGMTLGTTDEVDE